MIHLATKIGDADLSFASAANLASLAARIGDRPRAELAGWHFVRVSVGGEADVHALGFMHGDVYVTSPIRGFDARRGLIRTRSGKVYRMGLRGDDEDMMVSLAYHLVRALVAWGYAAWDDAWS
jgi:hypothetical protein